MKKLVCFLLSLAVLVCGAVALCGCVEGGDLETYINNYMPDVSDTDEPELHVASGSDVLPDVMIGTWTPVELYQYSVASDISDEEALQLEIDNGVSFGYSTFSRYGDDLSEAVFHVNEKATYDDISATGIQIESLVDKYGDYPEIVSIEVCDSDGAYCTALFLINNETLISYGAGMNVFSYERMEAVG